MTDLTPHLYSKILITGGGGMLAHALAAVFRERGHEAGLLSRDDLDVTNALSVVHQFTKHKPSLVLNCAAYTKVDAADKDYARAEDVNGKAVGLLAETAARHDAMLVHFSTDYVFDGSLRRPLRPGDPVGPSSGYGVSKLLGERMLQTVNPRRWLILRTAWLYGPGGPNFPQTMLNAARAGKPLKVISDQFGCPTYTFDLARATLHLLDAGARGIFHLSNSGQTNWFEFAQTIMQEFGVTPASLAPITTADWKAIKPDSANRPAYSVLDTSDYTNATGHTMPDWLDALRRYKGQIEA